MQNFLHGAPPPVLHIKTMQKGLAGVIIKMQNAGARYKIVQACEKSCTISPTEGVYICNIMFYSSIVELVGKGGQHDYIW